MPTLGTLLLYGGSVDESLSYIAHHATTLKCANHINSDYSHSKYEDM